MVSLTFWLTALSLCFVSESITLRRARSAGFVSYLQSDLEDIEDIGESDDSFINEYDQQFQDGYMPFSDHSEISPNQAKKLQSIERCNLAFASYLDRNKFSLTRSPPDLPVKVSVMFIVTNIYEVSEKDQTVTLSTFIELSWRDRRLMKGIDEECASNSYTIHHFAELLWFPLWTIENSAERTLYNEAFEKFPVVVHNRSVVTWITSFRIVLNCPMTNMHSFPFDNQNCYILIRSPHYLVQELQYYVYSPDQALLLWNENVSHPLWHLTGQLAVRPISNISGIEIWFRLERRPDFYVWTLMVPTFLISISTVLSFVLPSHSSEKLQTMLTGILAYFLLMLSLTELTPKASDQIPVITMFYIIVIAIGIMGSVFCAVIVRMAINERLALEQCDQMHNHCQDGHRPRTPQAEPLLPVGSIRRKRRTPPPKTSCCCIKAEQVNNAMLFLYLLSLIFAYVWLGAHTFYVRSHSIEDDSRRFKYTPVQVF